MECLRECRIYNACLAFTPVTIITTIFYFDKICRSVLSVVLPSRWKFSWKTPKKKGKSCTWLISCSDVLIRLLFIISFLSIGAMTCTVRLYPFCLKLFFRRWFFFLQKGKKNHAPFFQCYCIKIDVSLFQKLFFQVNKFSLLFFVLFFLMESLCVCVQEKKYNVVICLLNAIYSLCRHHDNRSLWERKIIRGMRSILD